MRPYKDALFKCTFYDVGDCIKIMIVAGYGEKVLKIINIDKNIFNNFLTNTQRFHGIHFRQK